ncbi:MAG: glycosyltransferase, partial [Odoribacter sp.]
SLDLAVFISQKGESYFHKRYPQCKTAVFRLGAIGNGITIKSNDSIVRVLTCSTVYTLKRVSLILESLKNATALNIEWTHIGDGIDLEKLKKRAKILEEERYKINLIGKCTHFEVIDYYKSHKVDLFINLSMNEGIPVSIMEAISFDIPIVATDVGCTSEIVTEMSGVLVDANPTIEQIVDAIYFALSHKYHPHKFWEQNYDASINYAAFAKFLTSLRND